MLDPLLAFLSQHLQNGLLLVLSVALGLRLRYWARMPDKMANYPHLDIYQVAYLAGGSSRVMDLIITRLVQQGYLHPNVQHRTLTIQKQPFPSELTSLEEQVLQQMCTTPALKDFRLQTKKYMKEYYILLRNSLRQKRLLASEWRFIVRISLPIFVLVSFSIVCFTVLYLSYIPNPNIMKIGETIQNLAMPWFMIGITTLCCFVPSMKTGGAASDGLSPFYIDLSLMKTRWGDRVLANLEAQNNLDDPLQRFALYGHHTLLVGNLNDLKKIFAAEIEEIRAAREKLV
jgi:uncharacterized protein (TIGR04222 family)